MLRQRRKHTADCRERIARLYEGWMGLNPLAKIEKRSRVTSKRPEKRKLVWRRDSISLSDGEQKVSAAGLATGVRGTRDDAQVGASVKPSNHMDKQASLTKEKHGSDVSGASRMSAVSLEKRKELDALRLSIREKKAALEKKKKEILHKLATTEELEESRRKAKKEKLEAGFAGSLAAEFGNIGDKPCSFNEQTAADNDEVDRILSAHTDYEVLNLHPGVDASTVKRRYREMAVKLHPDRCNASGASDAFQKMVKSYKQILKYAR